MIAVIMQSVTAQQLQQCNCWGETCNGPSDELEPTAGIVTESLEAVIVVSELQDR